MIKLNEIEEKIEWIKGDEETYTTILTTYNKGKEIHIDPIAIDSITSCNGNNSLIRTASYSYSIYQSVDKVLNLIKEHKNNENI